MPQPLTAGAAARPITPGKPMFLFGYPHVERTSTGVHDPLMASALYMTDGVTPILFVANDIIFVPKDLAARARARIEEKTGIPAGHIMISATHTHSGPNTTNTLSNEADPVVPPADPAYLRHMEDGIVDAALEAVAGAKPAEAGLAEADGAMVGTNRRDPAGPSQPRVPVLAVRERDGGPFIALMLVVSMHPTVLHEDSTLVSGDFPGMTRQYLQANVAGAGCPIVYHSGPCGNQSPRHVTRANTFEEAERLGAGLGRSVEDALAGVRFNAAMHLAAAATGVDLPLRSFPGVEDAERRLAEVKERLERLRREGAPRAEVRTAECDWFGAEETVTLARAAASGRLAETAAACLPAEIQALRIGPWTFVGWQGECFVEFGLAVQESEPDTYVIALANGELQGYLVTREAVDEGGYEASNAIFASPESGERMVRATLDLLARVNG